MKSRTDSNDMGFADFQERLGWGLPVKTRWLIVDVRNHSKLQNSKASRQNIWQEALTRK